MELQSTEQNKHPLTVKEVITILQQLPPESWLFFKHCANKEQDTEINQQLDDDDAGFEWCSEFESALIFVEHRIYTSDGASEVVFHGSPPDWDSLGVVVVDRTERIATTSFDDRERGVNT